MATVPTLDEYVAAMKTAQGFVERTLTAHRAPLRESRMFGPAGAATIHSPGERVIYDHNGRAIARVVEDEHHSTQIEENDRLHAVARPRCQRVLVRKQKDGTMEVVGYG